MSTFRIITAHHESYTAGGYLALKEEIKAQMTTPDQPYIYEIVEATSIDAVVEALAGWPMLAEGILDNLRVVYLGTSEELAKLKDPGSTLKVVLSQQDGQIQKGFVALSKDRSAVYIADTSESLVAELKPQYDSGIPVRPFDPLAQNRKSYF
jgi:hypothetical protein